MTSLPDRPHTALLVVESEPLVHKPYGDSFEDATLESELAQRAVGRLVLTGAMETARVSFDPGDSNLG